MSQPVNAPEQAPEVLQAQLLLSDDKIIVSKHELHALRFRVRILKKFLNRLSMRLDALTFQHNTATKTVEAR